MLLLCLSDQPIHVCEQAEILLCSRHQIRNEETHDPHVPVHTPGNQIHSAVILCPAGRHRTFHHSGTVMINCYANTQPELRGYLEYVIVRKVPQSYSDCT